MSRRALAALTSLAVLSCSDVEGPAAHLEQVGTNAPPPGVLFTIIEDLGTLPGGGNSQARDINSTRRITGSSEIGQGPGATRAFLWEPPGTMTNLGGLAEGAGSSGSGINNSNQVTGTASGFGWDVFLWDPPGPMVDLGGLGGFDEFGWAINNPGFVVGSAEDPAANPFLWTPPAGPMVNIGTLGGGFGEAADINDANEVVGFTSTAGGGPVRAFHWTQAGGMTEVVPLIFGDTARALGISNGGTIVGWSTTLFGDRRAVLWANPNALPQNLGTLGGNWSEAHGVNAGATVVGYSETAGGDVHAFRMASGGTMVDLGTLGGAESRAWGINGAGHAVGMAETGSGEQHAVAWWIYSYTDALECDCDYPDLPMDITSPAGFRVVMFGSRTFDARLVDVNTLSLGDGVGRDTRVAIHRGVQAARLRDENRDGFVDLTVTFDEQQLLEHGDLTEQTVQLILNGALLDRSNGVWGVSEVRVVR